MQAKSPLRPPVGRVGTDVVFLGAGVDRVLDLPLLNTLFRDLSDFVRGSALVFRLILVNLFQIPF